MDLETEKILAANLAALMNYHQLDQNGMAKRAGISQKTVSNLLSGRISTSIGIVRKVAHAFRLPIWVLLDDKIPPHMTKRVASLVSQYMSADDVGREHIEAIAERESSLHR